MTKHLWVLGVLISLTGAAARAQTPHQEDTSADQAGDDSGNRELRNSCAQSCTCRAGSYMLDDSKTCIAWQRARLVEHDSGDAQTPRVGMDRSGNAFAAWLQSNGTRDDVWASRYASGSWAAPERLDTDDRSAARDLWLTVDDRGRALALWEIAVDIQWSRFDGSWAPAETLWQDPMGNPGLTVLGGNRAGGAIYGKQAFHEGGDYYSSRRYNGTAWEDGAPIPHGAATAPPHKAGLDIALDETGSALAGWWQTDGNTPAGLWATRYTSAGGWGAPIKLNQGPVNSADAPKIAAARWGGVAIWSEGEDGATALWARRFVRGSWDAPAKIADTGDASEGLRAGIDRAGNIVAVWQHSGSEGTGITAARFEAARARWSTPVNVEAHPVGDASLPDVAVAPDGTAVVAWTAQSHVWVNRYTPAGGWSRAYQLRGLGQGEASDPRIAIAASGQATVVWQQNAGGHASIFASRLE